MNATKLALFETTMKLVATNGFYNFSMRQVTNEVGVSEAMIYKYFDTKENLFYECYDSMDKKINALFQDIKLVDVDDKHSIIDSLHRLWCHYFIFLVTNDYRTIFYFAYRESNYITSIRKKKEYEESNYFKELSEIWNEMTTKYPTLKYSESDIFWSHVLDGTASFAIKIIRKELAYSEANREEIWMLLLGGFLRWALYGNRR